MPITLPSGLVVDQVQELTGVDQDTLSNKQLLKSNRAVNIVLARRVPTIDGNPATEEVYRHMLSGDRKFLMVELRKASLGDTFEFTHRCQNPDCQLNSEFSVSLDNEELAPKPYPHKNQRDFTFVLPKSGHTVHFQLLDGVGEETVADAVQKGRASANTILLARRPRIKTPEGNGFLPFNIHEASLEDLTALRKHIKTLEGGVDTDVELTCPHCDTMNKVNLLGNASFFFPAAT